MKPSRMLRMPVHLLVMYVLAATAVAADPLQTLKRIPADAYEKQIKPFTTRYCTRCHGGKERTGGIAFDTYDKQSLTTKRLIWQKAARNLRALAMPPEGEPQPSQAEIDKIATLIDDELSRFDCNGVKDPGRVTIRRLNRTEYNNTIRDLAGVDFKPADDFPADDVGYGFDNIGDVLSMPPILLEKYLAAAEKITEAAVSVGDPSKKPWKKFAAGDLRGGEGRGDARGLYSSGEISTTANFPMSGEYRLHIKAYADQAGPEKAMMAMLVDGKSIKVIEVPAESNEPGSYEVQIKIAAGMRRVAMSFINDYYAPNDPNPNNRDRNLYVQSLEIFGPLNAPAGTKPALDKSIIFIRPNKPEEVRECARQVIERFATRAYRRPVKPDEVQRLISFVELAMKDGEPFDRGIQLALQAVLVSPHFLFRIELDLDPNNPKAIRSLNDFELATRLSYFLWSTMPDAELFDLAGQGSLRKPPVLEAQVRRMLLDPKAKALVENFAGQWLHLRNLKNFTPDKRRFPDFDEPLREAMQRETELFFETVMREDRSVLEFLDADFTFVNERLAKHYGISDIKGSEFQRVTLTDRQRGGVLTQASVLAVTSNPTRTSPVKRGRWVLEQLLGAPPPPPPPGVPELKEERRSSQTGSLRERMEQHRAKPSCAACHRPMDPLGFGLENFDAVGAWRTKDGRFDIDASGELPDGKKFNGPAELKAILKAKSPDFVRCLSEKMLTYGLGRGLEYYDKCAVDSIAAAVTQDNYRFSRLIMSIVQSEPFQKRRGKGVEQ